jgi:hypothetical protein
MNNVVDVLNADRDPDHVGRHARLDAFLLGQLFVCGEPRMNRERFGIANAGVESAFVAS